MTKSFGPILALGAALLASACNDGSVVGAPGSEPDESATPTAEASPVPTLPPVPGDIEIVLQWDDLGDDWELHLVKPGGSINDNATDCTWTSCVSASPDWGVLGDPVDDPHKDFDDVDQFGPERVWLANPEAGTYTVLVEHWGTGLPESDGSVTLDVGGQIVSVSMSDLAPQHVWTAARIAWPSGTITPTQDVFDCTASWAGGCTATLP